MSDHAPTDGRMKPCRQCHEDTTHADGFCSDSCMEQYNDEIVFGERLDEIAARNDARANLDRRK